MFLDPFWFLTWPSYAHPVSQEMRLFLVWDSEGRSEKKDTVVEDLFEACECDTDDESRGKKSKKRKKRSSSGSDDDAGTSEEESDSDEAW